MDYDDTVAAVGALDTLLNSVVNKSAKRKRDEPVPCACDYERCWVGVENTFKCAACSKAWNISHQHKGDDGAWRCEECNKEHERKVGKKGVCEGCDHEGVHLRVDGGLL